MSYDIDLIGNDTFSFDNKKENKSEKKEVVSTISGSFISGKERDRRRKKNKMAKRSRKKNRY